MMEDCDDDCAGDEFRYSYDDDADDGDDDDD